MFKKCLMAAILSLFTFTCQSAFAEGSRLVIEDGSTTTLQTIATYSYLTDNDAGGAINNNGTLITEAIITFTSNSATDGFGGAIENTGTATLLSPIFIGNSAAYGGAIDNYGGLNYTGSLTITGTANDLATFSGNSATVSGGGIFSEHGTVSVSYANFYKNTAANGGGIASIDTLLTIDNASFTYNEATSKGGAIVYEDSTYTYNSSISNSIFEYNETTGDGSNGGAIQILGGILDISNSEFNYNTSNGQGGAIASMINGAAPYILATVGISNSSFTYNTATQGGAISNFREMNISGSTFENNIATNANTDDEGGGALFLGSNSTTSISDSTIFTSNTATNGNGGAISTRVNQDNSGASLDISDSIFTSNIADVYGGAIYNNFYNSASNSGYVSILDSTFTSNSATRGGAIYNNASDAIGGTPSIYISGTSFTSNGTNTNITTNYGGAIYNAGIIEIAGNSSFTSNNAAYGGAIANWGTNASASISNSTFISNTATSMGGAIINISGELEIAGSSFTSNTGTTGGAIFNQDGTVTLEDTDFTGNIATSSNGGAISNISSSGTAILTITGGSFSENEAPGRGGAINNSGTLTIDGTEFKLNKSTSYQGGAIFNSADAIISNATFEENSASTSYGGAILNSANLTITGTTSFTSNIALGGGAIYTNGTSSIDGATFTSNKATSGAGGAISSSSSSADTTVTNSTFTSNTASSAGGAIYHYAGILTLSDSTFTSNSSSASSGGAIYNQDGTVTISDTTFDQNHAVHGGAVYTIATKATTVNISDSTFTGNYATGSSTASSGGAIRNQTYNASTPYLAVMNVADSTFDGNYATRLGGAVINWLSVYNSTDSTYTNNYVIGSDSGSNYWSYGGAIYGATAKITSSGDTFTYNHAGQYGGAISVQNSTLTITDGTFDSNYGGYYGGAVHSESSILTVDNTTFKDNYLNKTNPDNSLNGISGGAIYYSDSNSYSSTISNSSFESNTAMTGGGAIYIVDGNLTITDTDFTSNIVTGTSASYINSTGSGGAIYNKRGTLTISGGTYSSNTASDYGGAIYNAATLVVEDADFTSNTATNGDGGAIYNAVDAVLTIKAASADVTFDGNSANGSSNALYNAGTTTLTASSGYNIIFNDGISGSGTIIANGDGTVQLGADMTDFEGTVQIDSGTIKINSEGTYFNSANSTIVNGGTLDSTNESIDTISFGELTLNSSLTTAIDLTLNSEEADNYSATSVTGSGSILLDEINITLLEDADKLTAKAKISDSVLKDYISFSTTSSAQSEISTNLDGQSSYNWYITYETDSDGGYLVFNRAGVNLKVSVNAVDETKLYSMSTDETVTEDIGDLNGTTQVIAGNGNNITASGQSGIITTDSSQSLSVNTVNNITGFSSESGAFIYNSAGATVTLIDSNASENSASGDGGVINNTEDGTLIVQNGVFSNNSAENGGVIYNSANATIIDSNFTNNTASSEGGAIYNAASAVLNIISDSSSVTFSGNTAAGSSSAIYNDGTMNINSASTVAFNDSISGSGTININGELTYIDGTGTSQSASTTGTVVLNNDMSNFTGDVVLNDGTLQVTSSGTMFAANTLTINGGILDIQNSGANTLLVSNVVLNTDTDLAIDLDLSTLSTDKFSGTTFSGEGTINITSVNAYNVASSCITDSIKIHLSDLTGIDKEYLTSVDQKLPTVLSPIRYFSGKISDNYLIYAPTGNSYKDFNPSIMASSIAAQLGGYLTQINSYDEAFRNMDKFMLLTKKERVALKYKNKYAASDSGLVYGTNDVQYQDATVWARPYATFENVDLRGGVDVSNVAYGSFFGGDSSIMDLGHGWDGVFGLYGGYNGSHQAYDGVSIYQNGGTLGAIGMFYKGNFYTGLTANVGANAGRATHMYGDEDFTLLMAGIASKTGYNFELADGKFIVQPYYLMSYSFVNTFDYTNGAGIKIESDPLHAIQISPGIKFIGNFENGWQPYASVSMVWNIIDKTKVTAADISLPELSIKPYVKYGVGIQKRWGDRFTGYFQTYITNGGRDGVGLQGGFGVAFGDKAKSKIQASGKTPTVKPYKIGKK